VPLRLETNTARCKNSVLSVKKPSVFDNFKLKVDASDKTRYRVHCISSNTCPWRLHASIVTADGAGNPNTVEIKVFVAEHTCNGHDSSTRHPQAEAALISFLIQPRLKDHPNYRPNEIKKDARRDAFVNVSYSTAWRAKEKAMSNINGSYEDAYAQLPKLCLDLMEANIHCALSGSVIRKSISVWMNEPDFVSSGIILISIWANGNFAILQTFNGNSENIPILNH